IVDAAVGREGKIAVRARSGSTYVPSDSTWTDWQELGPQGGRIANPRGRYVPPAVQPSTGDPLHNPQLKTMRGNTSPTQSDDWASQLRVVEQHNERIVRTSVPFRYEPLDEPRLKALRQQYKLDDIVQGAQNELELLLRLAQWACNYWDWPNHITE